MELLKRIEKDLKEAIIKKDEIRISALRLLLSAIRNKGIELRPTKKELSEEIVLEVISREVKKRKEAIELFEKGEREDLAAKEKIEIEILSNYLPKQLSDDKIREAVQAKITELGVVEVKDFGKVMGLVMKELKGRVEGGKVSEVVKEELRNINKK